jgi:hypothetical protein
MEFIRIGAFMQHLSDRESVAEQGCQAVAGYPLQLAQLLLTNDCGRAGSRNMHYWQACDEVKALLGDKPLVLDRDFSWQMYSLKSGPQESFDRRIHNPRGRHSPFRLTPLIESGRREFYNLIQ